MRPVTAASALRAGWLLASASIATLVCSSNASFASCTVNVPGGQVLAVSGDTCNVTGSYSTTADGAIAGQATGLNALITGPSARTVTFSTTGVSANGLQADTGGQITLTEGTVTTTGNGSQGLSVGGVGSTLQASGVSVTTSGATDSDTGNRAYAVLAYSGGQITITGSSAATTGDSSYVAGIIAGARLTSKGQPFRRRGQAREDCSSTEQAARSTLPV
jgi:hypothetical protein